MKHKFLALAVAIMTICAATAHAGVESLTPTPAQITLGTGELTLSAGFTVGYDAALPTDMITEVNGFTTTLDATTGLAPKAEAGAKGLINVIVDASLPAEGYKLVISTHDATIKAATPAGLFYAFQTVKKLLPANVMAGVKNAETNYTLPVLDITDQPRFEYRGFMLDVSRHFFDVAQVKKMLDIMAVYKLNRFHWHLTDDQGWRLPVEKYPLLTTKGATNKDILLTDFQQQKQWRAGENVIYGPYAYTKEEIKDIVAYAKARHIEVIPEVDMPGHMVAAIHAYPEFSTDPENKNNVHPDLNHEIWNKGGVSRDVLDVSNPKVMTFVKDVIDVLAELFPYQYIHIGGDECPTLAWEKSQSCQAFMKEHNLTEARAIQSWFVKEIANYARHTHGRKIMGWNEIITDKGVDMNMIKDLNPTIFCWTGGEAKANQYGLKHVYTGINGGYYINRSYAKYDRVGAGRDGSLAATLNINPPQHEHCIGVQGTFWTEQVDRPTDLEYLALPRLIGIAEQGWSPIVNKDLDEFIARMKHDEELLRMAGYNYGAHQLVIPERRKPAPDKWYTIQTRATDDRANKVWEVHTDMRLRGNNPVDNREQQHFRFAEDPNHPGHYAIICRAYPQGTLGSTPSGTSLSDRWTYSKTSAPDYGFVLDKAFYGEVDTKGFYYAIRPSNLDGYYMNFSKGGQNYYINVYDKPDDGKGGQMSFVEVKEEQEPETPPTIATEFEPGKYYRLHTRFNGDPAQPRYGSVIELLRDDAGKGNNARADRLWSNSPAQSADANYDYQWFAFVPDPEGSGYYALVCKAKPEGSVISVPAEGTNNSARWDYDSNAKHYGFYLVDKYADTPVQGVDDKGFHSAFTSKDAPKGWYVNTAAAPQGYAIHLYTNPTDQNAGIYTFEPLPQETGINSIEAEGHSLIIYDLQGRRLAVTTSGVNIINGKKVVVK